MGVKEKNNVCALTFSLSFSFYFPLTRKGVVVLGAGD